MQILLFSGFAKKENSTKAPLVSQASRTLNGYLRDPCSIMNPVFKIERFPSDATPQTYTYSYIPEFGRWYFVEDWVWASGLWEAHLKEDVLASFKTEIGQSTEYILRHDSSTDFNGSIMDTTYPAMTNVVTNSASLPNPFTTNLDEGCYIVGIISGSSSQAVGAVSYYAMGSGAFGNLKSTLFSQKNLVIMGITNSSGQELIRDMSQEVLKTMYNPYQYIVSCMWFPFPVSAILYKTGVTSLQIGWWDYPDIPEVGKPVYRLYAQTVYIGGEQFVMRAHPQALRGTYLNRNPYTRRTLIGRFGTFVIDNAMFTVGDVANISYAVDLITGQCRTTFSRVEGEYADVPRRDVFAERNFLLGVPIQLAQVGVDYLGALNTAVTSGATATQQALTLNVGGAIASVSNGIYNSLQAQMPQMETDGQNGSFLVTIETKIIEQYYLIPDEDITHRGRPLCENRLINTLSGYILCADGELDISGYDSERKAIARYLTTGFYWE